MTRQRSWGTVVWAVSVLCLTVSRPAVAADLKIGFIDSERIFAEYAGTQEAQKSFNREVQELTKTAKEKKVDYDAFVQKNWGPQGSVSKLNEQYLKPIVDRVHKIVSTIGSGEGYSIILDAADGNIIFGDKSLDLTDRVLDQLRKEDSGGVPTAAPATSGGSQ